MSILLPDVLIDHNLGTIWIQKVFEDAGFNAMTVSSVFGKQNALDMEILEFAGQKQILFVTKDANIRKNRIERNAVFSNNVRYLCLVHQNKGIEFMKKVFEKHMKKIIEYSLLPGPWIVIVSESQIKDITKEMQGRCNEVQL